MNLLMRFSDRFSRLQSWFVLLQVKRDEFWASITHGLNDGVRFYAGHTRFATSSIVSPQTPLVFPLHTPSSTEIIMTVIKNV